MKDRTAKTATAGDARPAQLRSGAIRLAGSEAQAREEECDREEEGVNHPALRSGEALTSQNEVTMGRFFQHAVLCASICLIGRTAAVAQNQDGGNPLFWHSQVGSLGYIQVRDELKLTSDQIVKIQQFGDEVTDKYIKPSGGVLPADEPERRRIIAELRAARESASEKARGVLTIEQAARFKQIEIWINLPWAFTNADVVRGLDMTEQQNGALKAIGNECSNELRVLNERLKAGSKGRPMEEFLAKRAELFAKVAKERDELLAAKEAECLAVLTDDQKARFEKLRGPKFELDRVPARPK
jgi:hypothetical protein